MDPIALFHRLRGRPMGPQAFRLVMRGRCWWRQVWSWALDWWLVADLPWRGWAWRQRLAISRAWEADRSRLRYLEAWLSDQPS
jgi:hypothetical protein